MLLFFFAGAGLSLALFLQMYVCKNTEHLERTCRNLAKLAAFRRDRWLWRGDFPFPIEPYVPFEFYTIYTDCPLGMKLKIIYPQCKLIFALFPA